MRVNGCLGGPPESLLPPVVRSLGKATVRVANTSRHLPPLKLAVATALIVAVSAGGASAQMTGLNPTADEISQLPKFCWEQMGVPNAKGDAYRPLQCGPGTNHYCPGLVWLLRAKLQRDSRKKSGLLDTAANDVQYTEQWISSYPNCSIRNHVKATKVEVEMLRRVFGPPPSVKK